MNSGDWFAASAPLQEKQRRFRRDLTLSGYGWLAAVFVLLPFREHIPVRVLAVYVGVVLVVLAAWLVWGLVVTVRLAMEGRKEVGEWKATRDHLGPGTEPDTRS